MKFSILIANYNNGKFFEDCYQSIVSQTYENWECIIVDDCSTDDSVAIIENIIKEDARFQLYKNNENKGCGFTKNRCANLANGTVLGFLDPDDALETIALEKMMAVHLEHPKVALVHSKWKAYNENWEPIQEYKNAKKVDYSPNFFNLNGEITAFSSFKKKNYDKTSGIDSFLQRAVDIDLYLRLVEVGTTFFLDEFLYKYRKHEGGISTHKNVMKANYWRWFATMKAAERRNLNIENLFAESFVKRTDYNNLKNQYYQLKKFEPFQKWISIFKK